MKKLWLIGLAGLLGGCASLQPGIDEVSLQSYQQGCALRGIQQGLSPEQAQATCQCHVETAIAQTSRETFMSYVELVGKATPAERDTEAFKEAVALMKSTFKACRKKYEMAGEN
ncbi:MAG: hypothetical protein R3208_13055 [Ketobacteraceae bacterium]|nr:hypothetical protein [Ketobacteraceae bacterium]